MLRSIVKITCHNEWDEIREKERIEKPRTGVDWERWGQLSGENARIRSFRLCMPGQLGFHA